MKTRVYIGRAACNVSRREIIPASATQPAYSRWVHDGEKQAAVELWIDLPAFLAEIGGKALKTKAGKSRLASGLIEARVVGPITRSGAA